METGKNEQKQGERRKIEYGREGRKIEKDGESERGTKLGDAK